MGEFNEGPATMWNALESFVMEALKGCNTPAPSAVSASICSANTCGDIVDRTDKAHVSASPTTAVSGIVQVNAGGVNRPRHPYIVAPDAAVDTGASRRVDAHSVQL